MRNPQACRTGEADLGKKPAPSSLSLCAACLAVVLLTWPTLVPAAEAAKQEADPPRSFEIAGLSIVYQTYAGTEAGYDSNLDNLYDATGTPFFRVTGGLDVTATGSNQKYVLSLRANDFRLPNLDADHRWDLDARLLASFKISDTLSLDLESEAVRDEYSASPADIFYNIADLSHRGDGYQIRLRAKSTAEMSLGTGPFNVDDGPLSSPGALGPSSPGPVPQAGGLTGLNALSQLVGDTSIPRDRTFDFTRNELRTSLLWNTHEALQPFIIADLARIDYPEQDGTSTIDRNANDQYAIAGIRWKPIPSLWIDFGERVNCRDFDQELLADFVSHGIDIRLHWEPTDAVKVTGRVERFVREPTTVDALADDVQSIGATLDWTISPSLRLSARADYELVKSIGDPLSYDKLIGRLDAFYRLDPKVELYASILGRKLSIDDSNETAERMRIGSGFNVNF